MVLFVTIKKYIVYDRDIKSNILANNFVSTIKDLCTNMIVSHDIKPNISTINILNMFNRIKNKVLPIRVYMTVYF